MFYFLGIDIAGKDNTWAVVLSEKQGKLQLEKFLCLENLNAPKSVPLHKIVEFVKKEKVLCTAIDAPLSYSLNNETGLRKSDKVLKALLPKNAKNWVVSYHALMGVPLRALLLAEGISPYCGAILETHPRASFYFSLPEKKKEIAFKYKKSGIEEEKEFLLNWLKKRFNLLIPLEIKLKEGILDAIFCALAGYFYFVSPAKLIFLQSEKNLKGFGPFVVISPFKI